MDESTLKSLIQTLQGQRDVLNPWLDGSALIVVIGVILEIVFVIRIYKDELNDWRRGIFLVPARPSRRWLWFEIAGVVLVSLGVAGEFAIDVRAADLDTQIRDANGKLVLLLEQEAGDAKKSADDAAKAAARANKSADAAVKTASGARKEADSFANEIGNAKRQAAEAVSRLADAEQRLADATQREVAAEKALRDIKSPRSLVHTDALVAALKPFNGTKYTFNVFQDQESMEFTKALDPVLQAAGWVRNQPPGLRIGITTLKVFGGGPNDGAEVCVETGIRVHVASAKTISELQSTPIQQLPMDIRAAGALRAALQTSLLPRDAHNVGEAVEIEPPPAHGSDLRICVGRKP